MLNDQLSKNAAFILSLRNSLVRLSGVLDNRSSEASSSFELDLQKLE